MAHDNNGRIYIDTSTTPNKGVEISDLQQVLGRSVGDLGLLCSDQEWYLDHIDPVTLKPVYLTRPVNRINKWSKAKPLRDSNPGFNITDAGHENGGTVHGFAALVNPTDGIIIDGDIASVVEKYDSPAVHASLWEYLKPRGFASGEWFRILDFNGYNHNALCPVRSFAGQGGYAVGDTVTFSLVATSTATDGSLGLTDFGVSFLSGGFYYGIIVRKQGDNRYFLITGANDIAQGLNSLDFTFLEAGTWYAYPVICSKSVPVYDPSATTLNAKYCYYDTAWHNGPQGIEDNYYLVLPDALKLGPSGTMGKAVVTSGVSPSVSIESGVISAQSMTPALLSLTIRFSKGTLGSANFTGISVNDTTSLTWSVQSSVVVPSSDSSVLVTATAEPTAQTYNEIRNGDFNAYVAATLNGITYNDTIYAGEITELPAPPNS